MEVGSLYGDGQGTRGAGDPKDEGTVTRVTLRLLVAGNLQGWSYHGPHITYAGPTSTNSVR